MADKSQVFSQGNGNSPDAVEEIKRFIDETPKDIERGLLSPPATKTELDTQARKERMTTLLKIAQLRLATISYLGAANPYIDTINQADATIARSLQVVIATQAVQDIVNIHNDLELIRTEARKLYKDAGIELAPDSLSTTLESLAKLVKTAMDNSQLSQKKQD
jgi:hypothetical protein